LLVQSPDTLPLPTLDAYCGEPAGYLGEALKHALHTSVAFLISIHEIHTSHSQASILLRAAPDGVYILSHVKKDSSTQLTNFISSLENPVAYAMLAT
jgi:hypothetical protein